MQQRNTRTSFEYAAKRRQGYFREVSSTISAQGRALSDGKRERNPHLLALGCEEESLYPDIRGAGGAVDFFSRRGIAWWKSSRSGDDVEKHRPTRNMASSQVACVNFLLPLAGIPGALATVLRAIDDDVRGIVDICHEGNTSAVEFEWIGIGGSLEGVGTRGANATSIDAFLVAETETGRKRAYLLEWKYVEQYLRTEPDFKGRGKSGETRRKRYCKRYHAPYSSFNLEAAPKLDDFFYEPFYQLMRQRLLADRMVQEGELDVDEAKVVVVVPEQNRAYRSVADGGLKTSPLLAKRFPHLETVHEVMRAALKVPDAQFDMVAPSTLLDAVVRALPDGTAAWVNYWRERYGV